MNEIKRPELKDFEGLGPNEVIRQWTAYASALESNLKDMEKAGFELMRQCSKAGFSIPASAIVFDSPKSYADMKKEEAEHFSGLQANLQAAEEKAKYGEEMYSDLCDRFDAAESSKAALEKVGIEILQQLDEYGVSPIEGRERLRDVLSQVETNALAALAESKETDK